MMEKQHSQNYANGNGNASGNGNGNSNSAGKTANAAGMASVPSVASATNALAETSISTRRVRSGVASHLDDPELRVDSALVDRVDKVLFNDSKPLLGLSQHSKENLQYFRAIDCLKRDMSVEHIVKVPGMGTSSIPNIPSITNIPNFNGNGNGNGNRTQQRE